MVISRNKTLAQLHLHPLINFPLQSDTCRTHQWQVISQSQRGLQDPRDFLLLHNAALNFDRKYPCLYIMIFLLKLTVIAVFSFQIAFAADSIESHDDLEQPFDERNVPTIDISILYNNSAMALLTDEYMKCAHEIDQALQSEGVFMVTLNNNVEIILDEKKNGAAGIQTNLESIDEIAERGKLAAKKLFEMEKAVLEEVSIEMYASDMRYNNSAMRGYIGHGAESGLRNQFFESKDGFSYGHPSVTTPNVGGIGQEEHGELGVDGIVQPGSSGNHSKCVRTPLHGENIWPRLKPNPQLSEEESEAESISHQMMITDLEHIFLSTTGIAQVITRAIAIVLMQELEQQSPGSGLGLELQEKWKEMMACGDEISILRLFHYYNTIGESMDMNSGAVDPNSNQQENILGSSPHTDWGFLTIIIQDAVGGLQLRRNTNDSAVPGYRWIDVNPSDVSYSIVVNGGDYLSVITEYRYVSPIHRVLSPSKYNASDRYSFVLFFYPNYFSQLIRNPSAGAKSTLTAHRHHDEHSGKRGDREDMYNTLLVDTNSELDSGDNDNAYFGDYMIKKWQGVANKSK